MEINAPDIAGIPSQEPEYRPLAKNAVTLSDDVVLGVASTAPGVNTAGILSVLAITAGYGCVLAILLGYIPLLGVAISFYYLNRWRPDVGISYAWVGRLINPYLGAFIGFIIVVAFLIANTFTQVVATANLLTLFAPSYASNNWAITIVGTAILVLMTAIVATGIRIVARFQWILSSFEVGTLVVFATWALVTALTSPHLKGAMIPSLQWFTPSAAGGATGLIGAVLISVLWYAGWETAVVVNEETKGRFRNPGRAGIIALTIVLIVSIYCSIGFLSLVSPAEMNANVGSWVTLLGIRLAGRPWGYVLTLAIAVSFLATLETTFVTLGRVSFSMGRDRVFPSLFTIVSKRARTPWMAMLTLAGCQLLIFILYTWSGRLNAILSNLSSGTGFLFLFYYAVTGLTAAWLLRRIIFRSFVMFLTGFLLPAGGALFLLYVAYRSAAGFSSEIALTVLVTVLLGILIVLLARFVGRSPFFTAPESIENEARTPESIENEVQT